MFVLFSLWEHISQYMEIKRSDNNGPMTSKVSYHTCKLRLALFLWPKRWRIKKERWSVSVAINGGQTSVVKSCGEKSRGRKRWPKTAVAPGTRFKDFTVIPCNMACFLDVRTYHMYVNIKTYWQHMLAGSIKRELRRSFVLTNYTYRSVFVFSNIFAS